MDLYTVLFKMSLRIAVLVVLVTLAVVHTMPNPNTLDYRIPALYEEFLRQKSLLQHQLNHSSQRDSSSMITTHNENMIVSKTDEVNFRRYIEDPRFLAFLVNYMKQLESRYEEQRQSTSSQKTVVANKQESNVVNINVDNQVQDRVALYKQFLANNKGFMTFLADLFQQYLATESRESSSSLKQTYSNRQYDEINKHVVVKPTVAPITNFYHYGIDGYNGRTSHSYNQQYHNINKHMVVEPTAVPVTNFYHYDIDGYNGRTSQSSNQQYDEINKHVVVEPAVVPVTNCYHYGIDGYNGRTSHSTLNDHSHYVDNSNSYNEQKIIHKNQVSGVQSSNIYDHNIINNHAVNNQVIHHNARDNYVHHNEGQNARYKFASLIDDNIRGNFVTRDEVREGTKVTGSYSYDDGNVFRTVYYVADENGFRVVKDDSKPSQKTGNLDGTARVEVVNDNNSVKYQITSNDIGTTSGTVIGTTIGTDIGTTTGTTVGRATSSVIDTASSSVVGTTSDTSVGSTSDTSFGTTINTASVQHQK